MPVIHVSTSSGQANAQSVLTIAHTSNLTNARRMLVVTPTAEDNTEANVVVSSVSYGGAQLTSAASARVVESTFWANAGAWYLLDADFPAGDSNDCVISYGGDCDDIQAGVSELSGAKQATPSSATTTGTSLSALTATIETTASDAMLVSAAAIGQLRTWTPFSGQTERWHQNNASSEGMGGTRIVASPGSTNESWGTTGSVVNRAAMTLLAIDPSTTALLADSFSFTDAIDPFYTHTLEIGDLATDSAFTDKPARSITQGEAGGALEIQLTETPFGFTEDQQRFQISDRELQQTSTFSDNLSPNLSVLARLAEVVTFSESLVRDFVRPLWHRAIAKALSWIGVDDDSGIWTRVDDDDGSWG